MNSKICTSIEQSKKLLELGIDVNTADMFYLNDGISVKLMWEHLPNVKKEKVAWSLSALFNILSKQELIIKSSERNNECQYNIDIPIRHCKIWFSSLLDAAFEMIWWLKENNKI